AVSPLASKIGRLKRQSSDVAARFGQTCDQAAADRVNRHRKHNGDGCCRMPYGGDGASDRDHGIDVATDKLGSDLRIALGAALRPAILDRDGLALDPAEFMQASHKCSRPRGEGRSIRTQEPYGRQLLLRARRDWPSGHRAAEQRDERAALHSITSSVRASSEVGGSRPGALAVLRLMTNSNLVANCTGNSPGFSPLRMRST